MVEIIDDVPYEVAMQALADRKYHMIVDRQLATQALGASGAPLSKVVFLPYLFFLCASISLFYSWVLAVGSLLGAFFTFRLLRNVAIGWVRRRAVRDPDLYAVFAKHRIIWFTPVL